MQRRNRYSQFQPDSKLSPAEQLAQLEKDRQIVHKKSTFNAEGKQIDSKLSAADAIEKGKKSLAEWQKRLDKVRDAKAPQEAENEYLKSDNCALAIGYDYIEPSHAVTFPPAVLAVILSPDGMKAFGFGIIAGVSIEALLRQKDVDAAVKELKKFVDPNNRLEYLKNNIKLCPYPSNAPKLQF